MSPRLFGNDQGHEWLRPNNAALGDKCELCGVRIRWHKRPGQLGLVRQVLHRGEWVDVGRDPQCVRVSRWNRARAV